jgi:putative phosphotransacetylase
MSPEEAAAAGLRDGDLVDVRMCTDRPLTFHDVVVRSGPSHKLALHIDFDEANACGFTDGCKAVIVGKSGSVPSETAMPEPYEAPVPVYTEPEAPGGLGDGDVLISTGFMTEVQVRDALAAGAKAVVVNERTVVSPLANDLLHRHGIVLKRL